MNDNLTTKSTEKTLRFLGLLRPLKGSPGLFAVAVFSIALVEAVYFSSGVPDEVMAVLDHQIIVVVIGALVGMIAYVAGNFWDRAIFNRLYGHEGTRVAKPASTFFPSGTDLAAARRKAVLAIKGDKSEGIGIYRDCMDLVKLDTQKWKDVEEPVILSKVARAFVWPCVLAVVGCGLVYFIGPSLGLQLAPLSLLLVAVSSAFFAILLFIPYVDLRVEHMTRLYRTATQMKLEAGG